MPTLSPATPREVAEALASCAVKGEKVLPRGCGRALGSAGVADPCDVTLSLLDVQGVVDYSPGDMTITVLAGTRLDTIRQTIAARGQRLPGMPEGEGTIGGLCATGWTAPEAREAQGAIRERLLGVQCADPAGRLTRSGGRVVKNVTGYDLHRMHVGAGGALGIFTEVTLRLEPEPEHRAEVTLEAASAESARQAWRWLRAEGPDVALLRVRLRGAGVFDLVALLEGDDEPARRAARDLTAGWERIGRVQTTEPKGNGAPPPAQAPARLTVALRAAPSHALTLYEQVALSGSVCYPQSGEIVLDLQGSAEELSARLRGFAESAREGGPAYRVQDEAPAFLPPDVPRWSADPGALRLLARVKRTLDPGDVLRPGSYSAAALERAAQYFAESR